MPNLIRGELALDAEDSTALRFAIVQEKQAPFDWSLFKQPAATFIRNESKLGSVDEEVMLELQLRTLGYCSGFEAPCIFDQGKRLLQTSICLVLGKSGVQKNNFIEYLYNWEKAMIPQLAGHCTRYRLPPVKNIITGAGKRSDIHKMLIHQNSNGLIVHHELDAWKADLFSGHGSHQTQIAQHLDYLDGFYEIDLGRRECHVSGMIGGQYDTVCKFIYNQSRNGASARFPILCADWRSNVDVFADFMTCSEQETDERMAKIVRRIHMPVVKHCWIPTDEYLLAPSRFVFQPSPLLEAYKSSLPIVNGSRQYTAENAQELAQMYSQTTNDQEYAADRFYRYRIRCFTEAEAPSNQSLHISYQQRTLKSATVAARTATQLQKLFDMTTPTAPGKKVKLSTEVELQAMICAEYLEQRKLQDRHNMMFALDKLLHAKPSQARALSFVQSVWKEKQERAKMLVENAIESQIGSHSEDESGERIEISDMTYVGDFLVFGSSIIFPRQVKRARHMKPAKVANDAIASIVSSGLGVLESTSLFIIDYLDANDSLLSRKTPKNQFLLLKGLDQFDLEKRKELVKFLACNGISESAYSFALEQDLVQPSVGDLGASRKPENTEKIVIGIDGNKKQILEDFWREQEEEKAFEESQPLTLPVSENVMGDSSSQRSPRSAPREEIADSNLEESSPVSISSRQQTSAATQVTPTRIRQEEMQFFSPPPPYENNVPTEIGNKEVTNKELLDQLAKLTVRQRRIVLKEREKQMQRERARRTTPRSKAKTSKRR